jgi:hypothetical protein
VRVYITYGTPITIDYRHCNGKNGHNLLEEGAKMLVPFIILPKTRTAKLVMRLIRTKISNTTQDQDLAMIENPASLDNF